MKRFHLSTWMGVKKPSVAATPLRNTFRDVAITFENEAAQRLPLVKRLIDLHFNRAMLAPDPQQTVPAYDLMVFNLLLPDETGIIVIQARQQRVLKSYLRWQLYTLVRDKHCPFYDVEIKQLYLALLTVLDVIENYTSVLPLWKPLT